jgi:hypothetical protein
VFYKSNPFLQTNFENAQIELTSTHFCSRVPEQKSRMGLKCKKFCSFSAHKLRPQDISTPNRHTSPALLLSPVSTPPPLFSIKIIRGGRLPSADFRRFSPPQQILISAESVSAQLPSARASPT